MGRKVSEREGSGLGFGRGFGGAEIRIPGCGDSGVRGFWSFLRDGLFAYPYRPPLG